jgi:hypothetical protein
MNNLARNIRGSLIQFAADEGIQSALELAQSFQSALEQMAEATYNAHELEATRLLVIEVNVAIVLIADRSTVAKLRAIDDLEQELPENSPPSSAAVELLQFIQDYQLQARIQARTNTVK